MGRARREVYSTVVLRVYEGLLYIMPLDLNVQYFTEGNGYQSQISIELSAPFILQFLQFLSRKARLPRFHMKHMRTIGNLFHSDT